MTELSQKQASLRDKLIQAIERALPVVERADSALRAADSSYKKIAEVLVELRHEFVLGRGRSPDLQGRSAGYRRVVKAAYVAAGAEREGPLNKRLTVGVAYWVRKLLVERYGEEKLREIGILPAASFASVAAGSGLESYIYDDPGECLTGIIGLLNTLATDPFFTPSLDAVRSAARAVTLLQQKLGEAAPGASSKSARVA